MSNPKDQLLSIEEQARLYEDNRKYSSQANTVINKLKGVRKHIAEKRWVWELLQNASDYNEDVDIQIILKPDSLVFKHNGAPFTYQDAMNLIVPDSDKKHLNAEGLQDRPTIGQFGTGFLSTHILSLKINVNGLLIGGNNSCQRFDYTLDRTNKEDKEAMINAMSKAEEKFKEYKEKEKQKYTRDFTTSFEYLFNSPFNPEIDGLEVAKKGIEDLKVLLPYSLAFTPNIKTVTFIDQTTQSPKETRYQATHGAKDTSGIQSVTVPRYENGIQMKSSNILLSWEGNTAVAIEYENQNDNNCLVSFLESIPRLFFAFPLIGTESFPFPAVINNSRKNEFIPKVEREGIDLEENDAASKENRKVIEEAKDAYINIIKYTAGQKWGKLHLLTKIPPFKFDTDNTKQWYLESVWKDIRQSLLESAIVETIGGRLPLKDMLLPYFDDDGKVDISIMKTIYDLAQSFNKVKEEKTLPIKQRLPIWTEENNLVKVWAETLDFRFFKGLKYTLDDLRKDVSELNSFAELNNLIDDDTWLWLNQLIDILFILKYDFGNAHPIIPCQDQNGTFQSKPELYSDEKIEIEEEQKEWLKNLLALVGKDRRIELIHSNVKTKIVDDEERQLKLDEDFSKPINEWISRNSFEITASVILKLLAYIPTEKEARKYQLHIYTIVKAIWGEELSEEQKVTNWPAELWSNANDAILKQIAEIIFGKSLNELKNLLPHLEENSTPLSWHQSYLELILNDQYRKLVEDKELLPNQSEEGTFVKLGSLYFDEDLQDPQKDSLAKFGSKFDWRKILLDKRYNSLFAEEEKKKMFFGDRVKDSKKASEWINLIIQNRESEDYQEADIKNAVFNLIKFTNTSSGIEDAKRRSLWKFASELFPGGIEEVDPLVLNDFEWKNLEDWLLEFLVKEVNQIGSKTTEDKEKTSLDFLSAHLNSAIDAVEEEIKVEKWLSEFLEFVSKNGEKLPEGYAIIPNRYGDFCLSQGLKNNSFSVEDADKKIPQNLLDALGKIAEKQTEDFNHSIIHDDIEYALQEAVITEMICRQIDKLLADNGRGFKDSENIKEGVRLVKNFVDEIEDSEELKSLFPKIHQDIYKMAINAMGDVAKFASKIPRDVLKEVSEKPELIEGVKILSKVNNETLTKISKDPDALNRIEKAMSISKEDIDGISKNREDFIIEEAKKIIERLKKEGKSSSDIDFIGGFSDMPVDPNPNETNEYHKLLGRWGEKYINQKLTERKEKGEIDSLKWLNADGEKGLSHDFELKEKADSEILYIDIKTTEGSLDDPVYITEQEWKKIFEERENYQIYRVYHADLKSLPGSNSSANFFVFSPFQKLIEWMKEKTFQSCRMSPNKSTKIKGSGKLLE